MNEAHVKLSMADKLELHRLIDRRWGASLSGSEYAVVKFIFTNTIEWNKVSDRFKLDHFVNGIGKVCGTGLSKMTVRRALSALTERGALVRWRTQYGYVYAINFDWEPHRRVGSNAEQSGE